MGGIIGRLFHEFAVTIGVAILISGFVSLTLTPMLCSRFLKHAGDERHGRLYNVDRAGFEAMLRLLRAQPALVLGHRGMTMAFSVWCWWRRWWLFVMIPKGFLPSEDQGTIFGFTEAAQGISFEAMKRAPAGGGGDRAQDPDVERSLEPAGRAAASAAATTGIVSCSSSPAPSASSRPTRSSRSCGPKLAQVPGIRAFLQNPPPIRLGGSSPRASTSTRCRAPTPTSSTASRRCWRPKIRGAAGVPGRHDRPAAENPQVNIEIDRDQAASLGVSAAQIEDALYTRLRLAADLDDLRGHQPVPGDPGARARVPAEPGALDAALRALRDGAARAAGRGGADQRGLGPLTVNHTRPAAVGDHLLQPEAGVALGDAVDSRRTRSARGTLPATITDELPGDGPGLPVLARRDSGSCCSWPSLVIYMVLGILYESFIHPMTILSALPFAGFGALVTLHDLQRWSWPSTRSWG